MTEFQICVAGRGVSVCALFDSTKEYCKQYLWEGETAFSVEITSEDIVFEREQFIKADQKEGNAVRNLSDSYLETIALQRKLTQSLFACNTLLFHGSVVAVDGRAYLFTAKSGTGKSTHTRLWREMLGEQAVMVNDDKPFISVQDDQVIVHGSPWNGKHKLGNNMSVPLQAICILERGENNEIKEIPAALAVHMLFQQSSRPLQPELMSKYMELLDGVSRGVKFYRLSCNMSPEAARVSYEAMSASATNNT